MAEDTWECSWHFTPVRTNPQWGGHGHLWRPGLLLPPTARHRIQTESALLQSPREKPMVHGGLSLSDLVSRTSAPQADGMSPRPGSPSMAPLPFALASLFLDLLG